MWLHWSYCVLEAQEKKRTCLLPGGHHAATHLPADIYGSIAISGAGCLSLFKSMELEKVSGGL